MKQLYFNDKNGSFTIKNPENFSYLYFPLASLHGLKSAITPNGSGDSKIDQQRFLLEPVSSENLHNNRSTRNFWVTSQPIPNDSKEVAFTNTMNVSSLFGASAKQEANKFTSSQEESELTAGFMWQTLARTCKETMIYSEVTSFIPKDHNVEIMYVTISNKSNITQQLTPYVAIPIYARGADSIRDHRNVTSMLHRIKTTKQGIYVCPTMTFDERGHLKNHTIYYTCGFADDGSTPTDFYPTVESFLGEGGTYTHPRAVYENYDGVSSDYKCAGTEAMGAFRFQPFILKPEEQKTFIVLFGIEENEKDIEEILHLYQTPSQVEQALEDTKNYWKEQVNVSFHTNNRDFDGFMKWVSFQPFLRRLFGCSFLPHHDYGRGGRGWRDLWQDCLSLLLMNPQDVGVMISKNYGGVRIDGTNATIIGSGDGNFIADRNGITRVWMDHALWPLITTKLYIDQTGDIDILLKEVPYFKDAQIMRGMEMDSSWTLDYGNLQKTSDGSVYTGSILEHLLIQQLTAFYDVGDHNIYRLRGADWNDALDMASERGESVAFTFAYVGNLLNLATMIRLLDSTKNITSIELLEEIELLLNDDSSIYNDIHKKRELLTNYMERCKHNINGKKTSISLQSLAYHLIEKAKWLKDYLRENEWLTFGDEGWFNSYYDNHGNAVEGIVDGNVRMMLTGQVFAIMSGTATDSQIQKIVTSADHYLYKKECGGYRLNTDFKELKLDMGRMFGFAYGEKENGAVFSHMAVMYSNALFSRGYAKEGWKVLKSLSDTALDFNTSHIYPGIPEYFRPDGRGMYHYLTGAASWYLMTMITEVFGVKGSAGNLILYPKLLREHFDDTNTASINVTFAGKSLEIIYHNPEKKCFPTYTIQSASIDGKRITTIEDSYVFISRDTLLELTNDTHRIELTIG